MASSMDSAVQPWRMKRYLMRARVRFSRSSGCSRKISDDGGDDGEALILADEGGDADGDVGLGGEAAADAEGVADLVSSGR